MIIDENTGLPQLEDGKFWRVRQEDGRDPYSRVIVELCAKEDKLVPEKTEEVLVKEGTIWNFWKDKYETRVISEETTRKETVVLYSSELKETERFETGKPEGMGWRIIEYQIGAGMGFSWYERTLPITPESVLTIAEKIWTVLENKRTRRLSIQAVVGEYPPKKLEG